MRALRSALLLSSLSLLPLVPACGEPEPIDEDRIVAVGREVLAKVDHLSSGLAVLPDAVAYPTGVVIDGDPSHFFFVGKMHLSGGWVDVDGAAGHTREEGRPPLPWITADLRFDGYSTSGAPPISGDLHVSVKRIGTRTKGSVKGRVRAADEDAVAVEVEF